MKWLNRILASESLRANLNILYGEYEGRKRTIKLTSWKRRIILLIVVLSTFFSVVLFVSHNNRRNEKVQSIKRNDYGGGDKSVTLIAEIGGTGKSEKINVSVGEKQYTDEILSSYLAEVEAILPKEILGDNSSVDEVTSDLNLIKHIKGYPFNISWKSDEPMLLNSNGKVNKKKIKEEMEVRKEDIPVRLCATLSYEDFISDLYFYVMLTNDKSVTRETFLEDMKEEIEKENKESRTNEYQKLPRYVDGIEIRYRNHTPNSIGIVIVIGIICAVCLCISKDKEVEKQIHLRTEQMNRDYPKILNQYALYYCAGMNHRGIWKEICGRYELRNKSNKESRYAYEEMLITQRELDEGVGEIKAYESFANRCANVKYRSFINIIEQSVKKGGSGLDVILEEEIHKAYQEENNRVRMSAQEMTTKLLIPMLMMLIVVLVIVMVPAFISINK